MKRMFSLALVALTLSSCAQPQQKVDRHAALFEFYAAAAKMEATVSVTAEYDDNPTGFVFEYTYADNRSILTLVEPTEISGIEILLDDSGAVVGYGGTTVTAGSLGEDGATPTAFVPKLFYLWQNVSPTEVGSDKIDEVECLSAAWSDSGLTWATWFSADSHTPVAAEVLRNGQRVLFARFADATLTMAENQ